MKPIFGILVGILLTLAPATAWAQYPALDYTRALGAVTDISGVVSNPGVVFIDENGRFVDPCSPTVRYGQNTGFFGDPPRQTGGDGIAATADAHLINSGGRTESSHAEADALLGFARAVVTADTSRPCLVSEYGSLFMDAFGLSYAQFYRAYTASSDPTSSRVDLNWRLNGSFSSLTSAAGGGFASVAIYLLTDPPTQPVSWIPVHGGSIALIQHAIDSLTWSANVAGCALQNCQAVPKDPLVRTGGTIDVLQAYQAATGRPMTAGDSFIIGVIVTVQTQTCGWPAACAFTTDFGVSATIRSDVVVPQKR